MILDIVSQPLPRRTPPKELVTFDEFCDVIREDQKADLIDGIIHMATPPTLEHEDQFGFLFTILRGYVRRKGLGTVLGSRAAMLLSDEDAPEPDIMFISKAKLPQAKGKAVLGAADLVVEIVSPGSRWLDLQKKKELYARFGIPEYWVIDPFHQAAYFWKNNESMWEDLPVAPNNLVHSAIIPGFWLRLDWLFADELPDENEVLAAILRGALNQSS